MVNDTLRSFCQKSITAFKLHLLTNQMANKGLSNRLTFRWAGYSRAVERVSLSKVT